MTEADLQLVFDASGIKELTAQIAKLDASMAALIAEGNKAEKEITDIGVAAKKTAGEAEFMGIKMSKIKEALGALGIGLGIREVFNLGKAAVASAINYETLSVQFEVFLGSAEKATEVLASLNKFSIETPFTPEQVNNAGRSLLAFGVDANDLIPTLKMIGDSSAAVGKDFNELAIIFGKAKVAGKIMGDDLAQINEAGLPIVDELAKMYGVAASEISKLGAESKISFADFQQAFSNLSAEGGRFNGMMDKMSQSTAGLMSTIEGKLQDELRAIGMAMLPTIRIIAEGFEPAFNSLKDAFVEIYTPMAEVFAGIGELLSALNLGGKEGNKFASIVATLSKILKFTTIPMQLAWKALSLLIEGFSWAVVGIKDFVANSPVLMGAVEVLIAPFKMLGDAISWVSTSLGIGGEEIDATQAAYQGLLKELALVVVGMGGTAAQAKAFAQSLDVAKYASLSQADAVRAIQADFAAYIKQSNAATVSTDNFTKATGNMAKTVAGPAAGSIDFLTAKLSALKKEFTATGSDLERIALGGQIEQVEFQLMKFGNSVDFIKPKIQQISELVKDASELPTRSLESLGPLFNPESIGQTLGMTANKFTLFAATVSDTFKALKESVKGYMVQMAADVAFSIGEAMGAGGSPADIIKAALRELAVQIPKMTGMALLNAAAFPANAPIALPLAIAGLALLGTSGLISGIFKAQDKKRMQEQEMNGLAGMQSSGGGNGRQAGPSGLGESMGGVIDITLNIDGQRLAQLQYEALKKEQLKRR